MSERPVVLLRAELRQRWQRGERVQVECYLDQLPTLRADSEAVLDAVCWRGSATAADATSIC